MPRYAFFDADIRKQFTDVIADRHLTCKLDEVADEFLALVPDDLDATAIEELDEIYNDIMAAGMNLWDQSDEAPSDSAAAVKVQLSDGTVANIRFDSELLARLLEILTAQEVEDMVQDIALAVENPTDAPICVQRDQP